MVKNSLSTRNYLRVLVAGAECLIENSGWTPEQVSEAVLLWLKNKQNAYTEGRKV